MTGMRTSSRLAAPGPIPGGEADGDRRTVVEGLGRLVGALGGQLLAVGIESREQLEALRAAGSRWGRDSASGDRGRRWPLRDARQPDAPHD